MTEPITGSEKRKLKGQAQRLEPVAKIGKNALTPNVLASIDTALTEHKLIKVKFTDHKDQKKALAAEIATATNSQLLQVVGHVAIFYREA